MKTITDRHRRFLQAVADGKIKHVHPFAWVVPHDLIDRQTARTLGSMQRTTRLIRVDASSTEHQRPVALTDAGREALGGAQVTQ